MRDRLLMEEIWPRLGLDERLWLPWSMHTPFMVGFRQILFSKIVPNLRRLGLLTPRVRAACADLGILAFESLPDSTVDAETAQRPPVPLDASAARRHAPDGLSGRARSARARPRRPR